MTTSDRRRVRPVPPAVEPHDIWAELDRQRAGVPWRRPEQVWAELDRRSGRQAQPLPAPEQVWAHLAQQEAAYAEQAAAYARHQAAYAAQQSPNGSADAVWAALDRQRTGRPSPDPRRTPEDIWAEVDRQRAAMPASHLVVPPPTAQPRQPVSPPAPPGGPRSDPRAASGRATAPGVRPLPPHHPQAPQPPAYQQEAYQQGAYQQAPHQPAAPAVPHPPASPTAGFQRALHQPAPHQPAAYQPALHQPAAYQPALHQPAAYQPAAYQPAVRQPIGPDVAVYTPALGDALVPIRTSQDPEPDGVQAPAPAVRTQQRSLNQMFGYVFAGLYLAIGIFGFAVTGDQGFAASHGAHLLNIFEVNGLHNVVHAVAGALLGAGVAGGVEISKTVNTMVGLVFVLVGVFGLVALNSEGNIFALDWRDNVLHFGTAATLVLLGLFGDRSDTPGTIGFRAMLRERLSSVRLPAALGSGRAPGGSRHRSPSRFRTLRGGPPPQGRTR